MSAPTLFRLLAVTALIGLPAPALAVPSGDVSTVEVLGSLGLEQAQQNSCIAVWVPVGNNMAISGMKWYNNDGTVAFPEVLVQSGTAEYPVALPDAFPVAVNVSGQSGAWSEVSFSELVGSLSGGLYVIFRVPEGAMVQADGAGGGPAVGYTVAAEGYPGWMSADGEDWAPVHPDFGFAVRPILVESSAAMMFKSASKPGAKEDNLAPGQTPTGVALLPTTLRPATPNPFNPQTTLSFSLRADRDVDLAVFNLKGELVKRLVSERMVAGEHSVVWDGRDHRGSSLASGVYFARFVAGDTAMTQRLVLVQ
jgi:hypothetical protein